MRNANDNEIYLCMISVYLCMISVYDISVSVYDIVIHGLMSMTNRRRSNQRNVLPNVAHLFLPIYTQELNKTLGRQFKLLILLVPESSSTPQKVKPEQKGST